MAGYIVKDGELQSFINGEFDRKFYRGDSFGEFDLLNESYRKYTIKAMVIIKFINIFFKFNNLM